jgi:hypothetical protein
MTQGNIIENEDVGRSPDGSGSRPSDQARLRGLGHPASIPNACSIPPEGWWCSREAGHEGPCAAREIVPPWYAKLIKDLRDPPYWQADYAPDDQRLDIAPRHASDALEITLAALQSIKRVALACEGTPYDLILSYADHALRARPSCGFWVSGASAIEARRAMTPESGMVGDESAVPEADAQ